MVILPGCTGGGGGKSLFLGALVPQFVPNKERLIKRLTALNLRDIPLAAEGGAFICEQ
jgi:hypothetical protein